MIGHVYVSTHIHVYISVDAHKGKKKIFVFSKRTHSSDTYLLGWGC